MKTLMEDNFKKEVEYVFRDPVLFGDYRTALEEAEPRLYEDIQDFEAAKALFQEVNIISMYHFCCTVYKTLHCRLYQLFVNILFMCIS